MPPDADDQFDETPELAVSLDVVCALIELARDFQVKDVSTLADDEKADPDDLEAGVLEDRGTDPVELEMETLIGDLPDDAQVDLVALMWLGRDPQEDWDELRSLARDEQTTPTAAYLCGTPLLADYLSAGLAALGLDCRDWERREL
jgi:hypothetical protein